MKNKKIYKKSLLLATIGATLLTGCSSDSDKNIEELETKTDCEHLIIYYGDQPVIYKECESYDIFTKRQGYSSMLYYDIKTNNNETITSGNTINYHYYYVDHNNNQIDEMEEKAVEKGAHVYTLKK